MKIEKINNPPHFHYQMIKRTDDEWIWDEVPERSNMPPSELGIYYSCDFLDAYFIFVKSVCYKVDLIENHASLDYEAASPYLKALFLSSLMMKENSKLKLEDAIEFNLL